MQEGTKTINGQIFPSSGGFDKGAYYYQFNGTAWTSLLPDELWDASGAHLTANSNRIVYTVYDGAGLVMPLTFFGATWHNWPNAVPSGIKIDNAGCKFGASRSHDYSPNSIGPVVSGSSNNQGSLRWYALEPTNGDWNWWTNFDKWVDFHYSAGRELMYTLFACPPWATSAADQGSNYIPKASNPPDSNADWSDYCSTVATRAAGRIKYWEVWNEPNGGNAWFTGTQARYAELARLAKVAIKAVMPTAVICGPCTTGWTQVSVGNAESWTDGALAASDGAGGFGRDHFDAVSVHMYQQTAKYWDLPRMTARIRAVMATHGLSAKPLIDSESGFISPLLAQDGPSDPTIWFRRRLIYMAAAGFHSTYQYDMDGDSMGWLKSNPVRLEGAVKLWNDTVDLLMSGRITRVNMLWDGTLACIIDGANVLI